MSKARSTHQLPPPFLKLPPTQSELNYFRFPKWVGVYEYYAISDGCRRVFTNEDGIDGSHEILDPRLVSYMNLFINGVIQPKEYYVVISGCIKLKTEDVPIKGTPVILQMFQF